MVGFPFSRLLTGNIDHKRFRPAFSEPSLHRSSEFFHSRSPSWRNQRHVPRKAVPMNFGGDMLQKMRCICSSWACYTIDTRTFNRCIPTVLFIRLQVVDMWPRYLKRRKSTHIQSIRDAFQWFLVMVARSINVRSTGAARASVYEILKTLYT
jgi:hypothetical protein